MQTFSNPLLTPDDLATAARLCRLALEPALERDWGVRAGDLEWDCRRTLDHIADTLFFYAALLATRATARIPPPRNGDPAASPAQLLTTVEAAAAIRMQSSSGGRKASPSPCAMSSVWSRTSSQAIPSQPVTSAIPAG
jgi:hypothetical protein